MSELADLLILSLMWILCCLPVVTIGPATVALYYVTLKKLKKQDDVGIFRLFRRSFRDNWKVTAIIGIASTALGLLLYFSLRSYADAQGTLKPVFGSVTLVGGVIYLLLLPYLYGQMAWFRNTAGKYIVSGLYLTLRHILRSLLIAGITAVGILIIAYLPPLFLVVPASVVLGHCAILLKIFERYAPPAEDADTTDAGIQK